MEIPEAQPLHGIQQAQLHAGAAMAILQETDRAVRMYGTVAIMEVRGQPELITSASSVILTPLEVMVKVRQ